MITFAAHASSSSGNLYTVSDGSSTLLLECGVPIKQIRQSLGHKLHAVEACLVTHEHGDHAKAVRDVIGAGVEVYCSAGTAQALELFSHRLHIIHPLVRIQIGPWTVLPFDVEHDAADPLGFLIRREAEKILFAADTCYIKYRFAGLTHIALECNYSRRTMREDLPIAHKIRVMRSHMSIDTLLGLLAANDLSAVREIHLLHLSDDNSDEEKFKEKIQAATGIPVYVAKR